MLLKIGTSYNTEVQEFKVLEISPSGNWIRLMNVCGNKFWRAVMEVAVVEELKVLEARSNKEATG